MSPRRQNWLIRLLRRVRKFIKKVFAGSRSKPRAQKFVEPQTQDSPASASSTMTQVTQNVKGDRNTTISVVEKGAKVEINYEAFQIPQGEPNPFGVPYQRNRYFTGRQELFETLHQQLNQESLAAIAQIQAISGLGGVGKTQMAVEYAYRFYRDRQVYTHVFWVKSETQATLITDFANIANQLALPIAQGTQEEKVPAVKAWLANHDQWLLVFDNANTPEWLVELMPNNPKGKILLTSRASVFDEVGIRHPLALDVLPEAETLDFLFERTGLKRTKAEETAAIALNQELDGLPLALEQASAFILRNGMSIQSYLNTYRKRGLTQLEEERAKTGQYPSSVLKTWKLNMAAVSEESPSSAEVLTMSAFLAPDEIPYFMVASLIAEWDEALAEAIQTEDIDEIILAFGRLLKPLSQYSLVSWESTRQVYSMHRLVQAVVRDDLSTEQHESWQERVTKAVAQAYPGEEFENWALCVQLLPHWLQLIDLAHQHQSESEAIGTIFNQAGVYLNSQGRYGDAEPLYLESLDLMKRILGDEHPSVATNLNNLAVLYRAQGRYGDADPLYLESLDLRKRILGDEHPDVASSLNNLAFLYDAQGRYGDAEPLYVESLDLRKRILGDEHPDVASSLNNLAGLYYAQGRYGDAEPLYVESLDLMKRILGDEHPSVATSLNNLAALYRAQGRYDDAEPLYLESLDLRKRILGDEHPDVASSLNNLVELYRAQGRDGDAEPLYVESLDLMKRILGDEHPDVATSLNNLAALYRAQGRYDDAEPLYLESLDLRKRILGDEHPDVASSLNNLAGLYYDQGSYGDAEILYLESLDLRKRILGDEHPDVASSLNNLAFLYNSQGHYGDAEPLFLEALVRLIPLLGEEHPTTQAIARNLIGCLQAALDANQIDELSRHPVTQSLLEQLRSQDEEQTPS